MSRHRPLAPRTRRVWTLAHAAILVGASAWVFSVTLPGATPDVELTPSEVAMRATSSPTAAPPPPGSTVATGPTVPTVPTVPTMRPPGPPVPTKAALLRPTRPHFGISYPTAPFGQADLAWIARRAGAMPTMIEYFVKWTEDFRPIAVAACYRHGALPVISWEPWSGETEGIDQPAYSLDAIADGAHDAYLTRFARGVRDNRMPVVMRFAHEMNGGWYGWSERRSGNQPGDFVRAWRHVHEVFTRVGASNVIWVWSPNIVRPVPTVALRPLYPGDRYVDWVGLVGYSTGEATAEAVFGPTLRQIRTFTRLPVLVTETAAEPGPHQAAWTGDLFRWIADRSDVVGFVWFEYNKEGVTADWRFSHAPATLAAFRAGIRTTALQPRLR